MPTEPNTSEVKSSARAGECVETHRCENLGCGREFPRKRKHGRFCSTRCRMIFHGRIKPDAPEVPAR